MSKALDHAVARIRCLPENQQRIAAGLLEDFVQNQSDAPYLLSEEEERLIEVGLAELDRGERIPHGEIKALLAKFRR